MKKKKGEKIMTKKSGFTLAEVLITLGIIGVVAAMTIPTLIANTNSAKFRSQFKKSISTLNQAGLMAQAQYDIDYSTPTAKTSCAVTDNPDEVSTLCSIFNGTLSGFTLSATAPKLKSGENYNPTVSTTPTNKMYLTLADGSLVVFDSQSAGCTLTPGTVLNSTWISSNALCKGFIDVNGSTLPNKEVTCAGETATATSPETPCVVSSDANHMTDIFPIVFHDATVEPATNAAKYVLTTSK